MRRQFITQNGIAIRNGIAVESVAIKSAIIMSGRRDIGFNYHAPFNVIIDEILSPDKKSQKGSRPIAGTHEKTKKGDKSAVLKETLLETTTSYDGTPYSYSVGQAKLSVLHISIEPYTVLPVHSHAMPNVGYVLSGSITLVNAETREERTYHAGSAIPEMANIRHYGETSSEPCVLVVFYAGVEGQKLCES